MIIADSDVLIHFLRGRDPLASKVEQHLKITHLATTTVNVFELMSGARTSAESKKIINLLSAMDVLSFTEDAAMAAAELRRNLEIQGAGIGMADYLIAGVCLASSLPLLTANRKHFERVPGLVLI